MENEEELSLSNRVRIEARKQINLALPMVGVNLLQYSLQLSSVMLVGRLGELELSSSSIATSFCNVTGFSLLLGLASALDTLCGQSYGAKQYHQLGILMQRAIFVSLITAIPVLILWLNMENVLLFFAQAPDISRKAGAYTQWLIPGMFGYAFLQPLIRFLLTQSRVLPMFFSSGLTLIIHIVMCWTFIYKFGMGITGAALSVSISNWLNVVLLIVVIITNPSLRMCWPGFSSEAFKDIKQFIRLAIPSSLMVCFEWWAFEALVLLSGVLPNPQLEASVFSILLNTAAVLFMAPYGVGAAASTRVANELGAGNADSARFASIISTGLAIANAVIFSTAVLLTRKYLGLAFTGEKEVIERVAKLAPFLGASSFMDAIQAAISGVARGCGWQGVAAVVNLAAYYAVGLPLAYILAFVVGLKGKGLLIGNLCAVSTQVACFLVITALTNWRKQAEAALDRIEVSASTPLLS